MAFCSNCGQQLDDKAKFCPACGAARPVQQPANENKRKTVYEGEIRKCPNCGEVIDAFTAKCPACGFELNSKKVKEKANKNLEYLYLIRDFFTALAKNASGLILKNEELMLVTKFAPYFDGVPVLDVDDDEDSDDSVLGAFKEVGQELREAFISSKKGSNHFDFDEYLYRYSEKIEEYIMPDIVSAIENFNNAMAAQDTPAAPAVETSVASAPVASAPVVATEEIECPNCHTKLAANAKFCPECGNKMEAKKHSFQNLLMFYLL